MQSLQLPWAAWYGDGRGHTIDFPDSWQVQTCSMRGGEDIGDAGIRQRLASPIGSPGIEQLAGDASSAAILLDDLSRPTPAFRLLPYLLAELSAGGIADDDITIIAAVAAHRPMDRDDFIKKVGADIVDRYRVVNHNAYENLEFLGNSSQGVPIFVNRDFMGCQLRVALGMITPRGGFFGGGAKLLIPGACGQQTILLNHRYVRGEAFRPHLDEVARMAGLKFIVNPLLNEDLDVMELVAGDPALAYRAGCEHGSNLYATELPEGPLDIGVFNAFPKDTELCQAGLAMVPLSSSKRDPFTKDATIVMASACSEGAGWHSVLGPGTALRGKPVPMARRTFIYSPGVNRYDGESMYGEYVTLFRTWSELLSALQQIHGDAARVAVFPAGALQTAAN
ncbi:MAG: DUF2088 domain-containing protein [Gemmatimonadetes bacterium]|jgi:lactate racemase|nr:DUF2088 domain-containing protein [Gemmatimonadota bacterium]MBT6144458.1 DUF2088 domain-containing protein [Gemmatimonadota bacterium]MBT7858676.1 DUF2088 domain-containing protein [Gemmatimonadota bacterium]